MDAKYEMDFMIPNYHIPRPTRAILSTSVSI